MRDEIFIEAFGESEQALSQLEFDVSVIISMEKLKMKTLHQKPPVTHIQSSPQKAQSKTPEKTTNQKMPATERARREMMEREMEKVIDRKKVH